METTPQLQKPTLNRQYVVCWRLFGHYMIRAFDTYDEAENAYHNVMALFPKQIEDSSIELYLFMLLALYD